MSNGTATLSPATYIYTWPNATGAIRTDLASGTYYVTVTEQGNTCINVIEVEIGEINDLNATVNINSEPTCGDANGSVQIIVTNGSGDYDYNWENWNGNEIRNNMPAGPYSVTVTDNVSGCTTVLDFILEDNVAGANIIIVSNPVLLDCAGDVNATVDFTIDYEIGFAEPATVVICLLYTSPSPRDRG